MIDRVVWAVPPRMWQRLPHRIRFWWADRWVRRYLKEKGAGR